MLTRLRLLNPAITFASKAKLSTLKIDNPHETIDEPKEDKGQVAGSDYFKNIASKSNPNARTIQDLNLDEKSINLDNLNQLNNKTDTDTFDLKSKSQNYAKKFLNRQTEYHKKFSEAKIPDHFEPNEPITSEPRDWKTESHKIIKSRRSDKISRNKSYNEFRYKNTAKVQEPDTLVTDVAHTEVTVLPDLEQDEIELSEEEQMERDIKALRPAVRPVVYNLAYFVNDNEVLKTFVEMGVSIRKWDKDTSIGSFMLKLDLERDVKPHLIFLHDIGIPAENHAFVITKNPLIFKESIDDLNTRIEYLRSKNFSAESIKDIVVQAPKWLSLSVSEVDTRLGWFQREFGLSGSELREVVTQRPKLVTLPLKVASDIKFGLKEFLTYDDKALKSLIKTFPKLFTKDFDMIETNFIFLTRVMKLTHEEIALHPPVLVAPLLMLKSRFAFLKSLRRLQFDPTKPNYVSLKMFTEPEDKVFCHKSAKTTYDDYIKFLKTV